MQPKVLFLASFLMMCSNGFTLVHSIRTAIQVEEAAADRKPGQVKRSAEQPTLYRRCVYSAEVSREREQALSAILRRGHFNSYGVRQHIKETSAAVEEMLEVHGRFLDSLTEKQWTVAKDAITKLEWLRASIHAQLRGIDYELQMPKQEIPVLANYSKTLDKDLAQWQELYRKLGRTLKLRK